MNIVKEGTIKVLPDHTILIEHFHIDGEGASIMALQRLAIERVIATAKRLEAEAK
jgi:hypothetical protein